MGLKVEVRSVTHREGNKNGKPWAMDIATVIVSNPDGSEALGEIILPRGHEAVVRGMYEADVHAIQGQGSVSFVVKKLVAVRVAGVKQAA